ncbi:TetR family transcriptional regulator [Spirosoma sp. HMF3257]|uniref:TetR/AcrR family transcriptional regulator n=1 Tax=Spirosoma telluris TaxID=2183553 RepID=A0A327NTU2_9BACT|nr:TetR family transcriptional regulator [Spirosoma telluris]RAI77869.1 TetR/AcrR family transcriptional regulator [Spirosoma telluris]
MAQKAQYDSKHRLLKAALYLFNHFGFVSVRLQHIADEAGVSVGNLAYHFKTKDVLIETLYQSIINMQDKLLLEVSQAPIFSTIDYYLKNTFYLQQQYSFFFTDTLELMRAFPSLRQHHRRHISYQLMQTEWLLKFSMSRGALQHPIAPDSLALLSHRFTMMTENWMCFERMRGIGASDLQVKSYCHALWSLLIPYFTNKGKDEFQHLHPR